jgi:4-amino-4-deoxy-L-arabinose transferase-like glycosyltransferase
VSSTWETPSRASLAASATPVAARLGTAPARRAIAHAAWARAPRPELTALIALAGALNLWALGQNGWANTYYAAAVRSMSSSWHNFLYASLDPSGVMTVDKPPLSLWVQALSARVFGYHPLSLLIPQALMGVASVVLVYDLVRRRFGRAAGFIAGLALALTPMTVAVSRHNNPDALLVLCCVAALWCTVRALEDGRTRWLLLAGACVGLGFETKMGVALTVVPGIAAAWLLVAPRGRRAAARQLLAAGGAMTLVGGAWPALVELTPAGSRPWVSGTSDNSALSLIFGYNGLGRVEGQTGGPGGAAGGSLFGGSPGPLRLLEASLGGQAGWLLGFAVLAGVAMLFATRLRRSDPRSGWLVATGGAFVCTAALFSVASGIFHPYYVALLAPFTAALVGAGAGELIAGRANWRVVGPLAIAAGVIGETVVLGEYPGQLTWLAPLLIALGALSALALASAKSLRVRVIAVAAALALLLVAPSVWALDTLGHPASGTFPAGGPASVASGGPGGRAQGGFARRFGGGTGSQPPLFGPGGGQGAPPSGGLGAGAPSGAPPAGFGLPGTAGPPPGSFGARAGRRALGGAAGAGAFGGGQSLSAVLSYVDLHGGGTLAVSSQSSAASAIITQGASVAGIGGFSGRESAVSVAWLAQEVRAGKVRWVLADGSSQGGPRLPGDTRTGATTALGAVAKACRAVSLPSSASSKQGKASPAGASASGTLYDCQGRAAALSDA